MEISKALVAASSRPIILSILDTRETYGYRIIQRVREISGGALQWSDGMLYPVLHRLEKEKLIRSEWRLSDNGRMRKYYRITPEGKEALQSEREQWFTVSYALSRLWGPIPAV